MLDDRLDDALLLKISKSNTGKGTTDFQTVNKDGNRDKLVSGSLLEDSVVKGLVNNDVVLGLILNLSLGPFLLGLLSTSHGSSGLSGLGLLDFWWHLGSNVNNDIKNNQEVTWSSSIVGYLNQLNAANFSKFAGDRKVFSQRGDLLVIQQQGFMSAANR